MARKKFTVAFAPGRVGCFVTKKVTSTVAHVVILLWIRVFRVRVPSVTPSKYLNHLITPSSGDAKAVQGAERAIFMPDGEQRSRDYAYRLAGGWGCVRVHDLSLCFVTSDRAVGC